MNLFAHNGVDHATQAEVVTHQSNTTLWIVLISAVVAALLYAVVRMLTKPQPQTEKSQDKLDRA